MKFFKIKTSNFHSFYALKYRPPNGTNSHENKYCIFVVYHHDYRYVKYVLAYDVLKHVYVFTDYDNYINGLTKNLDLYYLNSVDSVFCNTTVPVVINKALKESKLSIERCCFLNANFIKDSAMFNALTDYRYLKE